jgi:hypothetical protein
MKVTGSSKVYCSKCEFKLSDNKTRSLKHKDHRHVLTVCMFMAWFAYWALEAMVIAHAIHHFNIFEGEIKRVLKSLKITFIKFTNRTLLTPYGVIAFCYYQF